MSATNSTLVKRPTHCSSRNSHDSGFESRSSVGPSTSSSHQQLPPIFEGKNDTQTGLTVESVVDSDEPSLKKLRLDDSVTPEIDTVPISSNRKEDLAISLIEACTSTQSVKHVKKMLKFALPTEIYIPSSLKQKGLKQFIAETMTNKDLDTLLNGERDPDRLIGTFGDAVCEWGACSARYETDDQLIDHVMEIHLEPMRPTSSTSKIEEVCQWSDCGLSALRGDAIKKHDWLIGHVTLKHTPAAHPHKCVFGDCVKRFKTMAQLNNHFRTGHTDAKEKRTKKEPTTMNNAAIETGNDGTKLESPFGYVNSFQPPIDRYVDNIDQRMFNWLRCVDDEASNMKEPVFLIEPFDPTYKKPSGAAKRKCRPMPHRFTLVEADTLPLTPMASSPALDPSGTAVLRSLFPSKPKVLSTRAVKQRAGLLPRYVCPAPQQFS